MPSLVELVKHYTVGWRLYSDMLESTSTLSTVNTAVGSNHRETTREFALLSPNIMRNIHPYIYMVINPLVEGVHNCQAMPGRDNG